MRASEPSIMRTTSRCSLSGKNPQGAGTPPSGDVQGLRAHWKSTLSCECPHCTDLHEVCVRDVYLKVAVDSLDWFRP
jgi:hypothetical protein